MFTLNCLCLQSYRTVLEYKFNETRKTVQLACSLLLKRTGAVCSLLELRRLPERARPSQAVQLSAVVGPFSSVTMRIALSCVTVEFMQCFRLEENT